MSDEPGTFKLRCRKAHFTYKTHIPKQLLLDFLGTLYPVRFYSICHESADEDHPYQHTHALVWFGTQPNRVGHIYDYKDIHPNCKCVYEPKHWANTFRYHTKEDKEPLTNWVDDGLSDSVKVQIDKITKKRKWENVLFDKDTASIVQQRMRWSREVFAYSRKKRGKPPKIFVRWGCTGLGKTRFVHDNYEDYDDVIVHNGFIVGYTGNDVVLIDDIQPDDIPYRTLLKLCDRHPCSINVKNVSVAQWNPKVIVLTSNYPPDKWYPTINVEPLIRRFREFGSIVHLVKDCTGKVIEQKWPTFGRL